MPTLFPYIQTGLMIATMQEFFEVNTCMHLYCKILQQDLELFIIWVAHHMFLKDLNLGFWKFREIMWWKVTYLSSVSSALILSTAYSIASSLCIPRL